MKLKHQVLDHNDVFLWCRAGMRIFSPGGPLSYKV